MLFGGTAREDGGQLALAWPLFRNASVLAIAVQGGGGGGVTRSTRLLCFSRVPVPVPQVHRQLPP